MKGTGMRAAVRWIAAAAAAIGITCAGGGAAPVKAGEGPRRADAAGLETAAGVFRTDGWHMALTSAASLTEGYTGAITEAEYWRYDAGGDVHRPIQLPDGKQLFITTGNGYIAIVDGAGKETFHKNQYVDLTAPAMNDDGEIWIGGKGARLYRYDAKGNGEMIGMFYFAGRKDGLMPSDPITDGNGMPYMAYQHAVLSLDADGVKHAALLPGGTDVSRLVPAKDGVYALGSDGVLYAVRGSAIEWQRELGEPLRDAKPAADGSGGVALLADKAIAAYEADGTLRFSGELAEAPAGGWTFPAVIGAGDEAVVVAAETGGSGIAAFRLSDGAERWRVSAAGAGGFGPEALTPAPGESGLVLAASRSGALYAIDAAAGSIAYSFKGAAAEGGAVQLGGGRVAYGSAGQLIAAGPSRPVAITYPSASLKVPMGTRLALADKLKVSVKVKLAYRTDNAKIAKVNAEGVVTPVAKGKANVYVDVASAGYKGTLKLPVEVTAAAALKPKHALQQVTVGGRTFSVQTVTIPKGMPVTLGKAYRQVGSAQSLEGIAKAYGAEAAINGTFFSAYDGNPEPYGMMMSNGNLDFVGNTGTTIGFTSDGEAMMDTLRVRIFGGVDGSSNNWYVYFVNKVPAKGANSAVMFTPAKGPKLGFGYGKSVTVRGGVVTAKGSNVNASIPSDGYVLVFTGSEEKLADRFKIGAKVHYTVDTKNLSGKTVDWSRVTTAVGAGPRLVKDGQLALNAKAEGFTESKILTASAARSGIMIKKDGSVVLATVPAATMKQWGYIMIKLGARQAMNLDGGASSGLYANGKLITAPGRSISNALVFGNQLKW